MIRNYGVESSYVVESLSSLESYRYPSGETASERIEGTGENDVVDSDDSTVTREARARVGDTLFAATDATPAWSQVTNGQEPDLRGRYLRLSLRLTRHGR